MLMVQSMTKQLLLFHQPLEMTVSFVHSRDQSEYLMKSQTLVTQTVHWGGRSLFDLQHGWLSKQLSS